MSLETERTCSNCIHLHKVTNDPDVTSDLWTLLLTSPGVSIMPITCQALGEIHSHYFRNCSAPQEVATPQSQCIKPEEFTELKTQSSF